MCLWFKLPNVSIYTPIEITKAKAQLCIKKGDNIQYFLLLRILYCTLYCTIKIFFYKVLYCTAKQQWCLTFHLLIITSVLNPGPHHEVWWWTSILIILKEQEKFMAVSTLAICTLLLEAEAAAKNESRNGLAGWHPAGQLLR